MFVGTIAQDQTFKKYLDQLPELLRTITYDDKHQQRLWKYGNYGILDTVDEEENIIKEHKIQLKDLDDVINYIDTKLKPKDIIVEK